MNKKSNIPLPPARRRKAGFFEDFRRFFFRGLAALLPTLITLWLLVQVWGFLWDVLGQHLITSIRWIWLSLVDWGVLPFKPPGYIGRELAADKWTVQLLGVVMAVVLVYIIGLFVGNIIGRTSWRLIEMGVMRVPLIRAIYPAVKQVTDFVLADRSQHFVSSRVVAVKPHSSGIWSIGLVTGNGLASLESAAGQEMVTVFIPSSPTAFSGYVVVVPRNTVVDLPMTVEQALSMLVTGGVVVPKDSRPAAESTVPAGELP